MATITREAVWAEADRLDAAGESVTIKAVREALGGGSFTTLSPLVGAWKQDRAGKRRAPADPIPAPLTQKAEGLIAAVWQQAAELANTRFDGERRQFEQAFDESVDRNNELAEIATEATEEAARANQRIEALTADAAAAHEVSEALRIELQAVRDLMAELKERARELEGVVDNQASMLSDMDEAGQAARDQVLSLQADLERQRGRADALEAQNRDLLAKLHA